MAGVRSYIGFPKVLQHDGEISLLDLNSVPVGWILLIIYYAFNYIAHRPAVSGSPVHILCILCDQTRQTWCLLYHL